MAGRFLYDRSTGQISRLAKANSEQGGGMDISSASQNQEFKDWFLSNFEDILNDDDLKEHDNRQESKRRRRNDDDDDDEKEEKSFKRSGRTDTYRTLGRRSRPHSDFRTLGRGRADLFTEESPQSSDFRVIGKRPGEVRSNDFRSIGKTPEQIAAIRERREHELRQRRREMFRRSLNNSDF